ncbi:MAG TPA: M56 family metallopeptidase [Longimicrobiales bacterium]|nr:M56 family metallopeptidase [Longimicrobiales bacterium]
MVANLVVWGADLVPAQAVQFLTDAAVKGMALLMCAAGAAWLLRRASAALRHLVWTIGVMGVLVLPVLGWVLPVWRIALPIPILVGELPAEGGVKAVITPASTADAAVMERIAEAPGGASPASVPANEAFAFDVTTAPEQPPLSWRTLILIVWALGFVVSAGSLLVSMVRVQILQRSTQRVCSGPCVTAATRVAARIGLARTPRIHVGAAQVMPMVWGLFRPVLLLPAGAARWPAARLEAVLLHELAHIRRRDSLTQFIAEVARAIYWFNPLVWLAARRLYIERELACDDIVLNAGTRPSEYAGELLDLVRSLRATRAPALAAIAMAQPSQITVRLSAVLDEARSRRGVDSRFALTTALIALGAVVPLAAMQPRAATAAAAEVPMLSLDLGKAENAAQAAAPTRAARPQRAPEPVAQAGAAAPAPAETQDTCLNPGTRGNRSVNSKSDDDLKVITWSSGRCTGSLRIEGAVRMSGDLTGVASISAGGLFRIEEDDGDVDRRLTIRPSNGGLAYDYRVDGRQTEFDAAGRAWLSQALLAVYRMTGFAADERIDYLLRSQGPSAVIAEVGQMSSDYVQRIYLQKLLERSNLTPTLVKSAIDAAARELDSDYEMAQTLIAYANKHDFDDETRTAFINATGKIESDYELRRVLSTALAKGSLRGQDVTAMLNAATSIGSAYERAQLLISLAERYKLEPAMRVAYLDAARGIGSDYEKRRVYESLLKQGGLSATELASVLEFAATIRSDYEKAQVLTGLSQFDVSDPTLQRAYVRAAVGIKSDYELRRALSALLAKERLASGSLDLVLSSALGIESDYELAQLLLMILDNHELNAQQREALMKALNTIDSSYEHGRVASALLKKSN